MATAETMGEKAVFWGLEEKGLERLEEEKGGHLRPANCWAKDAIFQRFEAKLNSTRLSPYPMLHTHKSTRSKTGTRSRILACSIDTPLRFRSLPRYELKIDEASERASKGGSRSSVHGGCVHIMCTEDLSRLYVIILIWGMKLSNGVLKPIETTLKPDQSKI